jgi:hypothetical protein
MTYPGQVESKERQELLTLQNNFVVHPNKKKDPLNHDSIGLFFLFCIFDGFINNHGFFLG